MPVGLTLFGAIFATVGFFVTLYGAVLLFTEGRRATAKPKLGLAPGVGPGTLSVWVNWDPKLFNVQIYRLRISHVSPENKSKEGTFTVTFENPQTEPFIQPIQMPNSFQEMLDRQTNDRSMLSFEFRTVDEMSLFLDCHIRKVKKIYNGLKARMPKVTRILPLMSQDEAAVFSLDFEELQVRKKRMKELETAAKAKAAKAEAAKPAPAAAKPAATPTPAATTTPAPAAKVEDKPQQVAPAPTPKVEDKPKEAAPVPAPKVEDKPVSAQAPKVEDKPAGSKPETNQTAPARSVRDVVSASNKNQTE